MYTVNYYSIAALIDKLRAGQNTQARGNSGKSTCVSQTHDVNKSGRTASVTKDLSRPGLR